MKKHTKFVALDIETTGLDFTKHEIIEIGCVLFCFDSKKKIFKVEDEFDIKIKPEHIELADKTSLKINKYRAEDWEGAPTLSHALKTIAKKIDGRVMVAHNAVFDYAFLEKAFRESHIKNTLHYHVFDTLSMAFLAIQGSDATQLSLRALCEHFTIENKKAHTALSDARATYELFVKLTEKASVV